jgi:hypothetical protein
MGPKAIVSLYSRDFSFEKISTTLFNLFDEGEVLVNSDHKFYRAETAKDGRSE